MNETHQYDDIIHMERPVSKKHPPMDITNRAAQFSPFAALTGHNTAIRQTEAHHLAELEKNRNQRR